MRVKLDTDNLEGLIAQYWRENPPGRIPEQDHYGIATYVLLGQEPGSFLTAVICDSLGDAFSRADGDNTECMKDVVGHFYNNVPGTAWRSKERMDAWSARGGLLNFNREDGTYENGKD